MFKKNYSGHNKI